MRVINNPGLYVCEYGTLDDKLESYCYVVSAEDLSEAVRSERESLKATATVMADVVDNYEEPPKPYRVRVVKQGFADNTLIVLNDGSNDIEWYRFTAAKMLTSN